MELLIISESKIKISLTKTDLDGYSISCDNIDYDTTETRRVVWSLLDDVKKQSGFDAAKSKIFVQIYPSRDGGCELYVSKLGKNEPRNEEKTVSVKKAEIDNKRSYYIFNGINEVLAVCKKLHEGGYEGKTDAYADEEGRFFLCADGDSEKLEFVLEFGFKQVSDTAELYIKEHCKAICIGCAVKTLANL